MTKPPAVSSYTWGGEVEGQEEKGSCGHSKNCEAGLGWTQQAAKQDREREQISNSRLEPLHVGVSSPLWSPASLCNIRLHSMLNQENEIYLGGLGISHLGHAMLL